MLKSLTSTKKTNKSYVISTLVVLAFSALAIILEDLFLPKTGVLLILQLAIIVISFISNKIAAIIASLCCALVFNYFFTDPLYSLHMTELEDIINTLIFLIVAIITSEFADHYRKQSEALRQADIRANILLSVSHDLRTPLSSIIGALSTFLEYKDKIAPEKQNELIEAALDESHRLHRYVENLLQATRLKNLQIKLTPSKQSIWPTIEKVTGRFSHSRIKLRKSAPLKLVNIQDSLLEQAIYNLVDNACKYSPPESEIIIEASSDANRTLVRVIDQGPGISAAKRTKVFEIFYSTRQGDSGEGGSGIGLAVAKGIVEAHGGELRVADSQLGCVMEIALPLASLP